MPTDYPGDPTTFHDVVELPSDLDQRSAACVSAPMEDLADNTAWLKVHGPVVAVYQQAFDDEQGDASASGVLNVVGEMATGSYTDSALFALAVPNVKAGDVLDISFHANASLSSEDAAALGHLRLKVTEGGGGSPPTTFFKGRQLVQRLVASSPLMHVGFRYKHVAQADGTSTFKLQGKVTGASGPGVTLLSSAVMVVEHKRPQS